MSVRVNQRWPDELHAAVVKAAGVRGVTRFTLDALERALEEASGTGEVVAAGSSPASASASRSASPRGPEGEPEAAKPPAPSRPSPGASTVQARPAVSGSVRPAIPKGGK